MKSEVFVKIQDFGIILPKAKNLAKPRVTKKGKKRFTKELCGANYFGTMQVGLSQKLVLGALPWSRGSTSAQRN